MGALIFDVLNFPPAVGSSVSSLSGLYTTAMKAAGASRRVFQLLDRQSVMPESGDKCPVGLVLSLSLLSELIYVFLNAPNCYIILVSFIHDAAFDAAIQMEM